MGDEEQQIHTRCVYNHIEHMEEREIVDILETICKTITNCYDCSGLFLTDCKTTTMPLSLKQIKCLMESTYNVPTVNEVAVVMAGDPCERRDIRIQRKDNTMQIIQDNRRSYDALQYPLIFWDGEDGYHLNIKQRNPSTGTTYRLCYNFLTNNVCLSYRYFYLQVKNRSRTLVR